MQDHGTEIESRNKCDLVMDRILTYITGGEYKPGDRLPPENFFAERFRVSRVTVRESIKKLSSMGVVTVKHGQGTFVSRVSPSTLMLQLYPLMMLNQSDIGQLYDARMYLESSIAELAAKNRTQEDVSQLKALLPQMQTCLEAVDVQRYNALDEEFHTRIGAAARNDILRAVYEMLNEVRKRGIFLSNRGKEDMRYSVDMHKKLAGAIERGDGDAARTTMMAHIAFSRDAALRQTGRDEA